ncbi:MAG: hypothetical protein ACK50Q_14340 [Labrys sp. (in: a-proteobacteria)]|jgi:hypothetical protein
MTFMTTIERPPRPREVAYLEALWAGERRPAISGPAGHMCRRLGWCEALYQAPDGSLVPRSTLSMDSTALTRAGYRQVGFVLTKRGRWVLSTLPSPTPATE